jgi:hypothetical protein
VIASGDLKKGVRIELEGAPWVVESVATVKGVTVRFISGRMQQPSSREAIVP